MTSDEWRRRDPVGVTARQRIAEFVICSNALAASELADRLGVALDELDRACWSAEVGADDGTDIDALIEQALGAAEPLWPQIRVLVAEGKGRCLLRIVAYISPVDATGAGFALSSETMRKLADVAAELDVDLYGV